MYFSPSDFGGLYLELDDNPIHEWKNGLVGSFTMEKGLEIITINIPWENGWSSRVEINMFSFVLVAWNRDSMESKAGFFSLLNLHIFCEKNWWFQGLPIIWDPLMRSFPYYFHTIPISLGILMVVVVVWE